MSRLIFNPLVWLLMLWLLPGYAQQQKDKKTSLQEQRARLQDEIQLASKILQDVRADRKLTAGQVQTFSRKVQAREQLIRNVRSEVRIIEQEIQKQEAYIQELEQQIKALQDEYALMIRNAYKSRSRTSRLMFVLASDDFAQALRRAQYMRRYTQHRRDQVDQIRTKQELLSVELDALKKRKENKEALKDYFESEKKQLLTEKSSLDLAIGRLQKQEKDLLSDIEKKKKEAARLNAEIEKIIAAEMQRAREEAQRKEMEKEAGQLGLTKGKDYQSGTSNRDLNALISNRRKELADAGTAAPAPATPASPAFGLTPEAQQLSNNFVANKNKLPWPVERGVLVRDFGNQRHPIATQVEIFNSGIDIATEKGAIARAVFEGEVSSVVAIPGSPLKAIILKHGSYFTVYSNLISVSVKIGDVVSLKQALGEVYTNEDQNESVLHFQLWKDMEKLDPKGWLFK
jgi:septal ring factor EnvC (AmiA/AmiB activator)